MLPRLYHSFPKARPDRRPNPKVCEHFKVFLMKVFHFAYLPNVEMPKRARVIIKP